MLDNTGIPFTTRPASSTMIDDSCLNDIFKYIVDVATVEIALRIAVDGAAPSYASGAPTVQTII